MEIEKFDKEIKEEIQQANIKNLPKLAAYLGNYISDDEFDIVKEIVQNADDVAAEEIVFHFMSEGLLVYHNGRPFSKDDIVSFCTVLNSNKDLDSTGFFGVGSKVILKITDRPCLASGTICYRIENGNNPIRISFSEFPCDVIPDNTYFWLPCTRLSNSEWEQTGKILLEKLRKKGPELLLFLKNIRKFVWKEHSVSFCYELDQEKLAEEVSLITVSNGNISQWVRFDAQPILPKEVAQNYIDSLWHLDPEEKKTRFEKYIGMPQRISLAIKVENERLVEVPGLAFARLPTVQETGLHFHIDARFQLNFERSRIRNDDPLGKWLLEHLAKLAASVPARMKKIGWFKPSVWGIFPKPNEVKEPFTNIADALLDSLQKGKYIHDQMSEFRTTTQVFTAHRSELYSLLGNKELQELTGVPDAVWPHEELRYGRAVELLHLVGVKKIEAHQVIEWLSHKLTDQEWISTRSDKWLVSFYEYLEEIKRVDSLAVKIRELPLVRTRSGRMVRAREALFPPEGQIDPVLEPYTQNLDSVIVANGIFRDKAIDFLRWVGVKDFNWDLVVDSLFSLEYKQYKDKKVASHSNLQHILILKELFLQKKITESKLIEIGRSYCILRDRQGQYVEPDKAYIGVEYAANKEQREAYAWMEKYFELVGGRPFVSPEYIENDSLKEEDNKAEVWQEFLTSLGVANYPRIIPNNQKWEYWSQIKEKAEKLGFNMPEYTSGYYHSLNDWKIDGLEQAIEVQLAEEGPGINKAKVIWNALAWLYYCIKDKSKQKSTLKWFRRTDKTLQRDASWVQLLRNTTWLPDKNGQSRRPAELWAPYLDTALGRGFYYLHSELPFNSYYVSFANFLGIKTNPEVTMLLDYLRNLKEKEFFDTNPVYPVYEQLSKKQAENDKRQIKNAFDKEQLIFIPDSGWYKTDEVCWYDSLEIVPSLKQYWDKLKTFFNNIVEVQDNPNVEHYAKTIIRLCSGGSSIHPALLDNGKRRRLYREIWQGFKVNKINNLLWNNLCRASCWPGCDRNGEIIWAGVNELVRNNNHYLASLFKDLVTWWALSDDPELNELSEEIGVKKLSQAQPIVDVQGSRIRDVNKTQDIADLWKYVRWFLDETITDIPPQVCIVDNIEVCYRINGVHSDFDENVKSWYSKAEGILFITRQNDLDLGFVIGDALEREFCNEKISEFVKDIYRYKNNEALRFVLQNWCSKLGRDPAKLGDEMLGEKSYTNLNNSNEITAVQVIKEIAASEQKDHEAKLKENGDIINETGELVLVGNQKQRKADLFKQNSPSLWIPKNINIQDDIKFTGRSRASSKRRLKVELTAIKEAKEWLESQGYKVQEVDNADFGCDFLINRGSKFLTYVEVKGRTGAFPITLTMKEWECAERTGDNYWVIIVQVDDRTFEPRIRYRIINPVRFPFTQRENREIIYEASADEWQKWAEEL